MAIVLPVLLLVTMGIVDFGFMFQRYTVLTNAAMEGARIGTLPGYTLADVQSRVQSYASGGGVNPSTIVVQAVSTTVPGANGGTHPAVEVTVSHNYTLQYIGAIGSMFGGSTQTITLRARSTMRSQIAS